MKKIIKKGFTLVELLVVIAILAILSTVTVVGYIAFTKKADFSVDQTNVTLFNSILDAEAALDGRNESFSEARADLFANGYDLINISPRSEGHFFAWDSETDHFVLVDANSSQVMWPEDYDGSGNIKSLVSPIRSQEELSAVGNTNLVGEYFLMDSFELTSIPTNGVIDLNGSYLETSDDVVSGKESQLKNGYLIPLEDGGLSSIQGNQETNLIIIVEPAIDLNKENNPAEKIASAFETDNSTDLKLNNKVFKYEAATGTGQISPDMSEYKDVKNITIENCIFDGFTLMLNSDAKISTTIESFTIKNCTFQHSEKYGMGFDIFCSGGEGNIYDIKKIEILNNKFINCLRGINISPAREINISGNYFELQNDIDNNRAGIAIMFQNAYGDGEKGGWQANDIINISNNTFQYGLTAVYLHFKMAGCYGTSYGYGNSLTTNSNNEKYFGAKNFSFSNNTYSSEYVICENREDFAYNTSGKEDEEYKYFTTSEVAKPYYNSYLAELAAINAKGRN